MGFRFKWSAQAPGDSRQKTIHTKLRGPADGAKKKRDLERPAFNQSVMRDLIADGPVQKFVGELENAQYVNTPSSKNALGTPVEGYVVPMFQSQVVIAYNPAVVTNPPKTFQELEDWIKANPKKFGYNGVTGGMSGVGFTVGYVYYKTNQYETFSSGVYDPANEASWADVIKELKSLPVVYTQGNAGTLDMLNRGEIAMGPVWVDMFYLWKSDGRMDPNMKMILPEPGLPGQPMYLIVSQRENSRGGKKFVDFIARPEIQAKCGGGQHGYPASTPTLVFEVCSEEAKDPPVQRSHSEKSPRRALCLMLSSFLATAQTVGGIDKRNSSAGARKGRSLRPLPTVLWTFQWGFCRIECSSCGIIPPPNGTFGYLQGLSVAIGCPPKIPRMHPNGTFGYPSRIDVRQMPHNRNRRI